MLPRHVSSSHPQVKRTQRFESNALPPAAITTLSPDVPTPRAKLGCAHRRSLAAAQRACRTNWGTQPPPPTLLRVSRNVTRPTNTQPGTSARACTNASPAPRTGAHRCSSARIPQQPPRRQPDPGHPNTELGSTKPWHARRTHACAAQAASTRHLVHPQRRYFAAPHTAPTTALAHSAGAPPPPSARRAARAAAPGRQTPRAGACRRTAAASRARRGHRRARARRRSRRGRA